MLLTCVLIDDEPLALHVLEQYMEKFPAIKIVQHFTDAIEGAAFLKENPVDLLLIDINMPDIKGTDLVRDLSPKPMIIFTTAYRNFAVEGFELDAVDYLVKPIEFERFSKAVQKAMDFYRYKKATEAEAGSLYVRSEYQLVKIDFADIDYIESVEDYLKIVTTTSRPLLTLMTMKAVIERLPSKQFLRIHRSYIVSITKIKSFVNRKLTLHSGTELPVSNSYVDDVKSLIN